MPPSTRSVPRRLRKLERIDAQLLVSDGLRVFVASSPRARLLGLALLDDPPPDCALLIPRCSSVHTFGMRFALDIAFLDARGRTLRELRAVPPRRLVVCRGAYAALELPARPTSPDSRKPSASSASSSVTLTWSDSRACSQRSAATRNRRGSRP